MTYPSLAHRVLDFYSRTISPFAPVASPGADTASQEHMHAFLSSVPATLIEHPEILQLPDVPDAIFSGMQKENPTLAKHFEAIARKLERFYEMLWKAGNVGDADDGSLVIDPQRMRLTKPQQRQLLALGLTVTLDDGRVHIRHETLPKLCAAWKLLSSLETEHKRFSLFCFSRSVFDPISPYMLEILKSLCDQPHILDASVQRLVERGYAYAADVGRNGLDLEVLYTRRFPRRSKPLTGLWLRLFCLKSNNLTYGLKLIEPVRMLQHYDDMAGPLKAIIFERTHACSGGYCRQTRKTAPIKAISLAYGRETRLTCPMFVGSQWKTLDEETTRAMTSMLAFNENMLTE